MRTARAGDDGAPPEPTTDRSLDRSLDLATSRRAQIIHAAVIVVARDGADRAKLKDVADEAGVSLGMVQHYFRTRDNLMAVAFQTMMDLSSRNWAALGKSEADPVVRLVAGLRLHVYGAAPFETRWGFWVELWAIARRDPETSRTAHDVYERWGRPFVEAVAALTSETSAPARPPVDVAIDILGLIDGLAVRTLVDPEVLDVDGMHRHLLAATARLIGLDGTEVVEADRRAAELITTHIEPRAFSPALVADVLTA